jgi:hypothetical protein
MEKNRTSSFGLLDSKTIDTQPKVRANGFISAQIPPDITQPIKYHHIGLFRVPSNEYVGLHSENDLTRAG